MEQYKRAFSTIVAWETRFFYLKIFLNRQLVLIFVHLMKTKRDSNIPPVVACLKELLSSRISQIDKDEASNDQIYVYQSSISMNIVR